jgi:hypothetical protein
MSNGDLADLDYLVGSLSGPAESAMDEFDSTAAVTKCAASQVCAPRGTVLLTGEVYCSDPAGLLN